MRNKIGWPLDKLRRNRSADGMTETRLEHDLLGTLTIPLESLGGIHHARARINFDALKGPSLHPSLLKAFGAVKLAAFRTNRALGFFSDAAMVQAVEQACQELLEAGREQINVLQLAALQGGAGTSTNLSVCEVLANRALQLLGETPGQHQRVSATEHLNLHQSTNDTFPTALRIASIGGLRHLERELLALQEAFQVQEKALAHVVKLGRTEYQDAVPMTLGREMGAYAEALNRDRWRLHKCEERLRVVNLGGTAIGTGLAAPRAYIFRVVDELRDITGLGLARAENLVEATQNADLFVEVMGLLKALASSLLKISGDLRLLSSGPQGGLGELRLPPRQAGSSIMPGKVNPVIPEAVAQVAMMVFGHDHALTLACSLGSLELNPFLPLVAHCLLESFDLLAGACSIFREHCVTGLQADEMRCRSYLDNATATVTALLPVLGYEGATALAQEAHRSGVGLKALALQKGLLTEAQFGELTSPESVGRLGSPSTPVQRELSD